MERKDFLGLIGFGVLGAQTGYVGACDAAEDSEPVAVNPELTATYRRPTGQISYSVFNGEKWVKWWMPK